MGERTHPRPLGDGAAATAPTAPHATPPIEDADERTGPARFWSSKRVQQGLAIGFAVSVMFHYAIAPISVMPAGPTIEFHEQAGDLSIPVDFIGEGTTEKPGNTSKDPTQSGGAPSTDGLDAAVKNATGDAGAEGTDGGRDASEEEDASASDDGGMIAVADGGVGRDPQSILGAAASVSAGPNNITVMVNFAELRQHPEGQNLGRVLAGIPQWKEFMANAQGTAMLDPMRDCDWMIIMGPSLIETQNDAVFLHYSTPDATIDRVIDTVAKSYSKGGPVDLGVRGVKAWKGYANKGERVFIRPRPHVVVIVPSSKARDFARVLATNPITPRVRAGEAFSIRAMRPGGSISVIPQDISEMRMWIVPRAADGGGDLYAEGDTPSDAAAQTDAETIKNLIQQKNSIAVRLLTAGFFNKVDVTSGSSKVSLHINGTQVQIEALLHIVAGVVGVTLPSGSGTTPAPSASSSSP